LLCSAEGQPDAPPPLNSLAGDVPSS